jgi:hypothetical protein
MRPGDASALLGLGGGGEQERRADEREHPPELTVHTS